MGVAPFTRERRLPHQLREAIGGTCWGAKNFDPFGADGSVKVCDLMIW
jgi:hypothetical protein